MKTFKQFIAEGMFDKVKKFLNQPAFHYPESKPKRRSNVNTYKDPRRWDPVRYDIPPQNKGRK